MKVKMQYPKDETGKNKMYDGKIHQIIPFTIKKVDSQNVELYIMKYFDIDLKKYLETILLKKDGEFYKIPLDNYKNIDKLEKHAKIVKNNLNITNIKLGESSTINSLFELITKTSSLEQPKYAVNTKSFFEVIVVNHGMKIRSSVAFKYLPNASNLNKTSDNWVYVTQKDIDYIEKISNEPKLKAKYQYALTKQEVINPNGPNGPNGAQLLKKSSYSIDPPLYTGAAAAPPPPPPPKINTDSKTSSFVNKEGIHLIAFSVKTKDGIDLYLYEYSLPFIEEKGKYYEYRNLRYYSTLKNYNISDNNFKKRLEEIFFLEGNPCTIDSILFEYKFQKKHLRKRNDYLLYCISKKLYNRKNKYDKFSYIEFEDSYEYQTYESNVNVSEIQENYYCDIYDRINNNSISNKQIIIKEK